MPENNSPVPERIINEISAEPKTKRKAAEGVSCKKTSIGGQALIEGLMMVGPRRTAMAIRKADGSILVEEIARGHKMIFFEKLPFFRGCIRLFRQLVTGTGALMKSAEFSEEEAPAAKSAEPASSKPPEAGEGISPVARGEAASLTSEGEQAGQGEEEHLAKIAEEARIAAQPPRKEEKSSRIDDFLENHMNVMIMLSAVLGIAFSVVLFILLPRLVVDFISHWTPASQSDSVGVTLVLNLVEGILRIAIFIGYLMVTSRVKDIARVWMYHGAEHKTIACYEAGEQLTVENIRKYSRFHPRCGTAFLFIVVIVSILVFSIAGVFIGVNIWWLNALIRIALVPFVAGIAYEIIHFTGKHDRSPVSRAISGPGLWMQRFTTREPDDSMLEVAVAALEAVLPENRSEDNW